MFVFCVFLTVYLEEFFMFLALHYASMLVWVLAMGSNFCGSIDGVRRPISELVYNLVIAAVLLFDIVNITEGATRLKNVFFYVLSGLEQATLLGAWYLAVSRWGDWCLISGTWYLVPGTENHQALSPE